MRKRREVKIKELENNFSELCKKFKSKNPFSGPSIYFYKKILEFHEHGIFSLSEEDKERFCEYCYACLTAWGMHRMGKPTGRKGTKLREFEAFKKQVKKAMEKLRALKKYKTWDEITKDNFELLLSIFNKLDINEAESKLIVNSKLLHFILPALVPPIDGTYTKKFLGEYTNKKDEEVFGDYIEEFVRLAKNKKEEIEKLMSHGRLTDKNCFFRYPFKILDNAIVEYVKTYQKKRRKIDNLPF